MLSNALVIASPKLHTRNFFMGYVTGNTETHTQLFRREKVIVECSVLNVTALFSSFPPGGKWSRIIVRTWWQMITSSVLDKIRKLHMYTQRDCDNTHKTCLCSRQNKPSMKRADGHNTLPLEVGLLAIGSCLEWFSWRIWLLIVNQSLVEYCSTSIFGQYKLDWSLKNKKKTQWRGIWEKLSEGDYY